MIFQTNKCLEVAPCANVPDAEIADRESSDQDGTVLITVNALTSNYSLQYGTTTRTFAIKTPVMTTPAIPSVVITSLLSNPVGDDEELETVTIQNKGSSVVSLAGWTLRDRSGATWNLNGSLAPGESRTFRREGQAMSLNNAGDEIVLVDASGAERDRFEYPASSDGASVTSQH